MVWPGKAQRTVGLQKGNAGLQGRNMRARRLTPHMTRKQIVLVFFMLLLLMGSSIGYVWSNFESTQIGYDLSQLKQQEMRLKEEQQKLRLELAFLRSPQRLQTLAFEKLGLRQPSSDQIVVLK